LLHVIYSTTICRYRGIGVPKISLVNEVQCGTGTEWRGLIGQHLGAWGHPYHQSLPNISCIHQRDVWWVHGGLESVLEKHIVTHVARRKTMTDIKRVTRSGRMCTLRDNLCVAIEALASRRSFTCLARASLDRVYAAEGRGALRLRSQ